MHILAIYVFTTTTTVLPFHVELIQQPHFLIHFLYVDVGTIIEVQQHIIAAKPIKTTDEQAPVTATECTASTSQVEPAATEAGSPAPPSGGAANFRVRHSQPSRKG